MDVIERQVRTWLERVVIGLNLCPFAGLPYRNGQIRFHVSRATTQRTLLNDVQSELERIDRTPAAQLETTLIVVAEMLAEFDDYNQFLDTADALLRNGGWEGIYQIASFHPHYRFQGTADGDAENLTNRSPWPILHILREASIDRALADYPEPQSLPERNLETMRQLSPEEIRDLFPWLADD